MTAEQCVDRPSNPEPEQVSVRAIFVSDVHLATRGSRSDALLNFLQAYDAPLIYLVGDIVDFWRIRRRPGWRASQTRVLQELAERGMRGVRIVYIPGNHDDELRAFAGLTLGKAELRLRAIHEAADGRRYLVIHGDEFDVVMRKARWLAVIGDLAYEAAMLANAVVNAVRERLGYRYWSLSSYLKYKVKRAVNSIGNFETELAAEAKRLGVQGVICGHIHHASAVDVNGVAYINTGDWVESCTAVVEHWDGQMELVQWDRNARGKPALPGPASALETSASSVSVLAVAPHARPSLTPHANAAGPRHSP
jgi:UDP-2,3-diacylglucosamine pyrophosphatase LpxH